MKHVLLGPLAEGSSRNRVVAHGILTHGALTACALLFCVPFVLCLVLNAGFLDLANEPLAYRFFYSERIFAGEKVIVGVGYLISLLHHAVYGALELLPGIANNLEKRLDLFALATNGILTLAGCGILYCAARSSRLTSADLALLGLVMLVPLYGTPQMGFEFALMADYNFLNMVLCAASVFLFQLYWRQTETPTRREVLVLGVFVGLAVANKITLLIIASAALIPAVAYAGVRRREFSLRALIAVLAAYAAFMLVHLASYLGRPRDMWSAMRDWLKFAVHPGEMPGFWDVLGQSFSASNYDVFVGYSICAFLLAFIGLAIRRNIDLRVMLVCAFCVLGCVAAFYFVLRRPAQTTLFESMMFIFTLAAVLLTVVSDWRPARIFIAAACIAWAGFAGSKFPVALNYELVAGSQARSRLKWDVFERTRRIADGRPIEVIFPDNTFHHEGVFELLLKAASDFPGWTITKGEKTIIERYCPGLKFRFGRQNGAGTRPEAPYEGDRVLVWFDRSEIPPLPSQFPELAKALAHSDVIRRQWQVPARGGDPRYVTMNVALLPPFDISERTRRQDNIWR